MAPDIAYCTNCGMILPDGEGEEIHTNYRMPWAPEEWDVGYVCGSCALTVMDDETARERAHTQHLDERRDAGR